MDPFESRKIDSGTTGLVDDWRLKLAPPLSSISPQPTLCTLCALVTPDHQQSPSSSLVMAMLALLCVHLTFHTPSPLSLTILTSRLRTDTLFTCFRGSPTGKRFTWTSRIFLPTFAQISATRLSGLLSGISLVLNSHGLTLILQRFNSCTTKSIQHTQHTYDAMMPSSTQ